MNFIVFTNHKKDMIFISFGINMWWEILAVTEIRSCDIATQILAHFAAIPSLKDLAILK